MWVLKDKAYIRYEKEKQEKLTDKNRYNDTLRIFFRTFILVFIGQIIYFSTFGFDHHIQNLGRTYKLQFTEIPSYSGRFAIVSAVIAFILAFLRLRKTNSYREELTSLMCDKCFKSKPYDENCTCECGGRFMSMSNFRWVEEDDEDEVKQDRSDWIEEFKVNK